jgi:two-component system, LytTR family, response regulator
MKPQKLQLITAIVIDDVDIIRSTIISQLKTHAPHIHVVAQASSVATALEQIALHQPTVLFLDIELGDGSGFDVLQKINAHNYKVIFITAYNQYAVRAFRLNAIDYLLKPIDADELIEAVSKLQVELSKTETTLKYNNLYNDYKTIEQKPKNIVLKTANEMHVVLINDIVRCESSNNYTSFYLKSGKRIVVSITLKEYEALFEEYRFFRNHQSHLINLNYFDHLNKETTACIVMKDGTILPISQRKQSGLETALLKPY